MDNFREQIVKTLSTVADSEGVLGNDLKEVAFTQFSHLDSYLAVKVLSMMIEAGDIELNIVSDSLGKKDYLEKLLGLTD